MGAGTGVSPGAGDGGPGTSCGVGSTSGWTGSGMISGSGLAGAGSGGAGGVSGGAGGSLGVGCRGVGSPPLRGRWPEGPEGVASEALDAGETKVASDDWTTPSRSASPIDPPLEGEGETGASFSVSSAAQLIGASGSSSAGRSSTSFLPKEKTFLKNPPAIRKNLKRPERNGSRRRALRSGARRHGR